MIVSLSGQAISFLVSALGGFILGVVYDIFRVFRRIVRHKTAFTTVTDAVFWIISTLLMFYILLYINSGQFRGYFVLGAVLGCVIYLCTLSPLFIKLSLAVLYKIKRLILIVTEAVTAPFRWLYNLLRPKAAFIYRTSRRKGRDIKRGLQYSGRYVRMKSDHVYKKIKRRREYAEQGQTHPD